MFFASDNAAPAAPEVMAALAAANAGPAPAYGADVWTKRVAQQLAELFEHEVAVSLVTTGTAANSLALSLLCPPYRAVLAHEEAHAIADEGGAPEFFTGGAKLVGMPGEGAKLAPDALRAGLAWGERRFPHSVLVGAVTVTQATELGTVYRPAEISALAELCRSSGVALHMDGARFANAIATLGCTPAEATWRAGVDALSFGFTKNGALAAEAVVFFDASRGHELEARRKRSGHLWSKGRFIAAQIEPLLVDGLWLRLAGQANSAAARLAAGFERRGFRLSGAVEANEVFVVLPQRIEAALRAAGAVFYSWDPPADGEDGLFRFVCAWSTRTDEVEALLGVIDASA
jgi:threonine aldolase